jgi:UDP-N-acetylglucosamine:LPS N-acetylglucosamine transferase
VLPEDRLTYRTLTATIEQILGSKEEQAYLSKAIAKFAVPDAAERLAKLILEHATADGERKEETDDANEPEA